MVAQTATTVVGKHSRGNHRWLQEFLTSIGPLGSFSNGSGGTKTSRTGLCRFRSVETGRILYIGQTGRSLRGRLGSLRGVYGDVMPYNAPHTAGPALWAHRIDTGETLEVSVAVLEVDNGDRNSLAVEAIT